MSEASERILVVDDEAAVREVIQKILESAGYLVQTAASGQEAIDLFSSSERRFSLIILDVDLPDIKGGTVLEQLTRIDAAVAAMVCTSLSREEVDAGFEGLPVAAYMSKPFRLNNFLTSVERAIAATAGTGARTERRRDSLSWT